LRGSRSLGKVLSASKGEGEEGCALAHELWLRDGEKKKTSNALSAGVIESSL